MCLESDLLLMFRYFYVQKHVLNARVSHVKRNKTLLASMPSFVVSRELVIENTARSKHVSLTIGLTASYTISQN